MPKQQAVEALSPLPVSRSPIPDSIRRAMWRALAACGLARLRGPSPRRGVHLAQWKGPGGEDVLIPVRDDGRIAIPFPVYVRSPDEFADAMTRCWHMLENADPIVRAAFTGELEESHTESRPKLARPRRKLQFPTRG